LNYPKLAIDGATPKWPTGLETYPWIRDEDFDGLKLIIQSQQLSLYLGQSGESFLGGKWVKEFEERICEVNGHHYAVSFNSWTSGLEAIFLSLDLKTGSEVIVPTWTMSATISSIVNAGFVPRFVDIDEDHFTIDISGVADAINDRTGAICSVDLFGRSAEMEFLRDVCDRSSLYLVADSAQAPGARYKGIAPSKWADVGGYSLNRHKHFQTGEGGIAVTDNLLIAERLQAIRNHGEIAAPETLVGTRSIYGHNWRMGEMEAFLGYKQYMRFSEYIEYRRNIGELLRRKLRNINGINLETLPEYIEHDYYILGMRLSDERNRDFIASALRAEGLPIVVSKYSELQNLPAFIQYPSMDLKNAVHLNDHSFLGLYLAGHLFGDKVLESIENIFIDVFNDSRSVTSFLQN
jgi:perosamine synthetase